MGPRIGGIDPDGSAAVLAGPLEVSDIGGRIHQQLCLQVVIVGAHIARQLAAGDMRLLGL